MWIRIPKCSRIESGLRAANAAPHGSQLAREVSGHFHKHVGTLSSPAHANQAIGEQPIKYRRLEMNRSDEYSVEVELRDGLASAKPGPEPPDGMASAEPGPEPPDGMSSSVPGPALPDGMSSGEPGPEPPDGMTSRIPGPEPLDGMGSHTSVLPPLHPVARQQV